ncbi:hypothetical protein FM106_16895 [Brachybacterium faecium]|nr:hypothetical protein FM106_16895 [Brachybacterium faecium]
MRGRELPEGFVATALSRCDSDHIRARQGPGPASVPRREPL